MDDKYNLIKVETPDSVEVEIDKCDRCGKVLDARTDSVLLSTATDEIFCVPCALRKEGATKEEIADPAFVEVATSGITVKESRALSAKPAEGFNVECPNCGGWPYRCETCNPTPVGDAADLVVENGEFPIIEQNRLAKHSDETDADFRRRILESFLSGGGGCTKNDIRAVLSMVDGVELVGIMEDVGGPGTIEIIIIGEGFERFDIMDALHNHLPVGVRTIGKNRDDVFNAPYRWSEYRTVEDFFARFVDFTVQTATGETLDRWGALVGVTRNVEDGDFYHPGEPDASFRDRLLGPKKGKDR